MADGRAQAWGRAERRFQEMHVVMKDRVFVKVSRLFCRSDGWDLTRASLWVYVSFSVAFPSGLPNDDRSGLGWPPGSMSSA
jgi:hypothetical protein